MRLYLCQHADALPKEEDPERGLTDEGARDAAAVAEFLARSGIKMGRVLHSPRKRARQTAEILAARLSGAAPAEAPGLLPTDDPLIWAERLGGETVDLMLVGHMPHLGLLASHLASGSPEAGVVAFSRGSVCCLERDEFGLWSVVWMVTPGLLKGKACE